MTPIEEAVNIGEVLAGRLRKAGVATLEDLRRLGAVGAWERIAEDVPEDACTHTLYALEGAVRGVRWMSIPDEERQSLLRRAGVAVSGSR